MFDRVDTGYYLSGGTIAVGGTAEVLDNVKDNAIKKASEAIDKVTDGAMDAVANKDIMDIDVLLGLIPGYELHISGLIMILGLIGMILSRLDGKRRKQERIENNRGDKV